MSLYESESLLGLTMLPQEALKESLLLCLQLDDDFTFTDHCCNWSEEDWQSFIDFAKEQGVSAVAFQVLVDNNLTDSLPVDLFAELKQAAKIRMVVAMKMFNDLSAIVEALNEENIRSIALKGVCLAKTTYKSSASRPMGDIDLLIASDQLDSAREVLLSLGYTQNKSNQQMASNANHHLPPFCKDLSHPVEVHYSIFDSDNPKYMQIDSRDFFENTMAFKIGDIVIHSLSSERMLIHLCYHAAYHHHWNMGLRNLVDIYLYVKTHDVDWQKVLEIGDLWQTNRSVLLSLFLCHKLLNYELPNNIEVAIRNETEVEAMGLWAESKLFNHENRTETNLSRGFLNVIVGQKWYSKLVSVKQAVFIPRNKIQQMYGVEESSWLTLFLYVRRIYELLRRYSGKGIALLFGKSDVNMVKTEKRALDWMLGK